MNKINGLLPDKKCPLCGEQVLYEGLLSISCFGHGCPNEDKDEAAGRAANEANIRALYTAHGSCWSCGLLLRYPKPRTLCCSNPNHR